MDWIINKIVVTAMFAALIASNIFTFHYASDLQTENICKEAHFYYGKSRDTDVIKIRQCEEK